MAPRKRSSPKKKVKSPLKFTKITDTFSSIKRKTISEKVKSPEEKEPINEKELLHQFDLNWEYGPAIGISRLERWERADKFHLDPPRIVKEILLKHDKTDEINKCVWNYYYNVL